MNSSIQSATGAVLTQAESQIAPLRTVAELWEQHFPYNRRALNTGIVHFGPGRFFRGHLARIVHRYLVEKNFEDQRWGICGVSLKSRRSMTTLQPQNFLYTLVERHRCDEEYEAAEVIGSINQIVNGVQDCAYVLDLMASPSVHLVTLTVTQAGYCLDSEFNLDLTHDAIAHDLRNPLTPTTPIGFIVEALRRRQNAAIAPFTTLSCDNLPRNGEILQRAVLTYAQQVDPQLADYLHTHAAFPNTVVDRIVPQAQESDEDYPCRLLQVDDPAPIITEPFWQFVVEDRFSGDRPRWEEVGVTMTDDITPFLYIKSRFLNAVHSFIACLALRAGFEYIHEALRLPEFHLFVRQLMDDITAATPVPNQLCEEYIDRVLLRLSNEALPDAIERISAETSRKLGKYIVPILQDAFDQKLDLRRLMLPIAAWMLAIKQGTESGMPCSVSDKPSVVDAVRSGAAFSQIIGLELCDCVEMLDRTCDRALQDLEAQGLSTTLRQYSEEPLANGIVSAA